MFLRLIHLFLVFNIQSNGEVVSWGKSIKVQAKIYFTVRITLHFRLEEDLGKIKLSEMRMHKLEPLKHAKHVKL